jgi:hypothetical protein
MSKMSNESLLRTFGSPIRETFQNDFAAPTQHWADRVNLVIDQHPDELRTMAAACPTDQLRYSTASYFPDLFDDCGSNGLPIPFDSDEAIDAHMATYWPNHVRRYCDLTGITPKPADTPYTNYGSWEALHQRVISDSARKKLAHTLKVTRGHVIDPDEWREYQAVDEVARKRPSPYTLGVNAVDMCAKDRTIFRPDLQQGAEILQAGMSGQHESFVVAANVALSSLGIAHIRMPIGEYGSQLARDSVAATWLLAHAIQYDQKYEEEAEMVANANPDLYTTHTMRAYGRAAEGGDPRPASLGITASHQEGNLAVAAGIGLMTGNKIDGWEKGHDAINWLARHDMPTQLAKVAALNFIAANVHGAYYPHPLEVVDRVPYFTPGFVGLNNAAHRAHQSQFIAAKRSMHLEGVDPAELSAPLVARTGLRGCGLAYAPKLKRTSNEAVEREKQLSVITLHTKVWARLFNLVRSDRLTT